MKNPHQWTHLGSGRFSRPHLSIWMERLQDDPVHPLVPFKMAFPSDSLSLTHAWHCCRWKALSFLFCHFCPYNGWINKRYYKKQQLFLWDLCFGLCLLRLSFTEIHAKETQAYLCHRCFATFTMCAVNYKLLFCFCMATSTRSDFPLTYTRIGLGSWSLL